MSVVNPANRRGPAASASVPAELPRVEEWVIERVPADRAESIVEEAHMEPIPPCVHAFVERAAQVRGAQCIVAEFVDDAIHITTFLRDGCQESARAIYEIEADTIQSNPNIMFDFHVRRAADAQGGTPVSVEGAHFFAVWGELENAGAR
jgi:hypothetical protein